MLAPSLELHDHFVHREARAGRDAHTRLTVRASRPCSTFSIFIASTMASGWPVLDHVALADDRCA